MVLGAKRHFKVLLLIIYSSTFFNKLIFAGVNVVNEDSSHRLQHSNSSTSGGAAAAARTLWDEHQIAKALDAMMEAAFAANDDDNEGVAVADAITAVLEGATSTSKQDMCKELDKFFEGLLQHRSQISVYLLPQAFLT